MKKVIFIFSLIILAATIILWAYQNNRNDDYEDIFSIKTSYSYISNNGVNFNIKVYSSKKESLLAFGKEAEVYLHDKSEENVIKCSVNNVYINETVLFDENYYYEYIYDLNLDMSKLKIKECYMKVKFENKEYDFMIGSFEIVEKKIEDNIISISNLYGLTSDDNSKSLCGIVVTFNNIYTDSLKIDEITIGSNYKVFVNENNIISCSESNNIYDYLPNYSRQKEETNTGITLKRKEKVTLLLPIKYEKDFYLYNAYLLVKIGSNYCYFSNFTYIDSTDIDTMNKYVIRGNINEF
jgi:hypothetical protein